jgi:hypothetical protein
MMKPAFVCAAIALILLGVKVMYLAMPLNAAASVPASQGSVTIPQELHLRAQCEEDVSTLWLYAYMRRAGRLAYDQVLGNNARAFASNDAKRIRLDRLATLAYQEPRFARFAGGREMRD